MKNLLMILAMTFAVPALGNNHDETASQKVDKAVEATKEAARDTGKGAKKAYRGAKDKTCEMVNGKMECAAQKAKHSIQNGVDEVKDKADDVTN